MKGKKIDTYFLSNFITECINKNISSTDEILNEAKSMICSIDSKIKEINKLKEIRCKLQDVIYTFENKKSSKDIDNKKLDLFKITNIKLSKNICDIIKCSPIKINEINNISGDIKDILFCIKQMLDYKIIARKGDYLLRGEKFYDYVSIVLCEV